MWFLLALGCAFCWALSDALSKRALADVGVLAVTTIRFAYSLPFLWAVFPFIRVPDVGADYWLTLAAMTPLELMAAMLYVKAIQTSPLSLTLPYLAFTPVFLVATGYLVLGERVDAAGLLGILAVTAGAYVLNVGGARGLLAPLAAIARERGSRLMLVVAALYSVTGSLGKKAVLLSSPEFFAVTYTTLLAATMFPLAALRSGLGSIAAALRPTRWTLGIGAAFALMILLHAAAVQRVEVAYMISVKRSSMVFGVLFGWAFFHEREIAARLAGTLVMLAGIVLILIF